VLQPQRVALVVLVPLREPTDGLVQAIPLRTERDGKPSAIAHHALEGGGGEVGSELSGEGLKEGDGVDGACGEVGVHELAEEVLEIRGSLNECKLEMGMGMGWVGTDLRDDFYAQDALADHASQLLVFFDPFAQLFDASQAVVEQDALDVRRLEALLHQLLVVHLLFVLPHIVPRRIPIQSSIELPQLLGSAVAREAVDRILAERLALRLGHQAVESDRRSLRASLLDIIVLGLRSVCVCCAFRVRSSCRTTRT
jgi:hypothetical protein